MKKVLIIYPHFPPSNLVGVHRIRLFAHHLENFGWQPTILTVHEDYYEEKHDFNLLKLINPNLRIEKVKALKIKKPRLIGDIGLRAFFQLYKKGKHLLKSEKYDFLLCSIPSFYCALLGRILHNTTGVKYGIDYQDPWVHYFPGSNKIFSRHWFSTKLATFLEPIAVKKASLICGINESYYYPVLQRNSHLQKIINGAIPMGGEQKDFDTVSNFKINNLLFKRKENKIIIVYAGAILPKAILPLQNMLKSISNNISDFDKIEFHFIGTGKKSNDVNDFTVKQYAEQYGLWDTIIFEYPARLAYLDVLVHLQEADGIFILGSTEPHYTPSKVYQAVLSKKPLFAILHNQSSAVSIIENNNIGKVVSFNGEDDIESISNNFADSFKKFTEFLKKFDSNKINIKEFEKFSASKVTENLVQLLNKATQQF